MNFDRMRALLLEQAIQGKLVPQLENEPEVAKNRAEPEKAPFEIPKKWKWYSLGEVIDYGKVGQVGSSFVTDNTWVLDLEDIEKNTGRLLTKKRGLVSSSNKNIFKKGWVLYSKLRPYLNKVVIADEDGICTTEIVPINTNESKIPLLAGYLKAYLMSPYFLSYANRVAHGVKMPRIGTKEARAALIPIPPIEEQSRIIQKLSNSFKQIQCASEAYNELNTLSKNLKQQVLLRAIQGRLVPQLESEPEVAQIGEKPQKRPFVIPEKWKWIQLGNVGRWKAGGTPSRSHAEYYQNGNIPWLKTGDLTDGIIRSVEEYITEEAIKNSSAHINPIGSVLIAMYGATIGKLGVLSFPCATNQACCACDVNTLICDRWYLFYYLLSQRENFIAQGVGGAQPNISRTKIVNYWIPLPPIEEQRRIVSKIKDLFRKFTEL